MFLERKKKVTQFECAIAPFYKNEVPGLKKLEAAQGHAEVKGRRYLNSKSMLLVLKRKSPRWQDVKGQL